MSSTEKSHSSNACHVESSAISLLRWKPGRNFRTKFAMAATALASQSHAQIVDESFNPSVNGTVVCIAQESNAKILIGGGFTHVGGQPRLGLARINTDGTLDSSFFPNLNSGASIIIPLPDGKFIVGGNFTIVDGQTRHRIARLNSDGSLDETFFASNPNFSVEFAAKQTDGKILIGGGFTVVSGQTRNRLARLNADGSIDTAFDPNVNGTVYSIELQPDGKILIGGAFGTIGGQPRSRMARLNSNGTLDSTFAPNPNSNVHSIDLRSDGKILVGGFFTSIGGQARNRIARLNGDGTLDLGFDDPGFNDSIQTIRILSDSSLIVGGRFTMVNGVPRNRLARLDENGTLDQSFNANVSGGNVVYSVEPQSGGAVLVGGWFNIQSMSDLVRLISGTSSTRAISLSGDLAFGDVQVGQNSTRVLTIQNTGNSTLTVSGISYPAGFSGDWSSGTVAAGGVRTVNVTFFPTAVQNYGENLTVGSDATEGVSSFSVTGAGVAGAATRILSLSGDLTFGSIEVGQSASRTLTIGNTGNAALSVSGIGYPTGFYGNWNGGTIPAGGTQSVTVTFTPTLVQTYGGSVVVASNATSGSSNRTISGIGFLPTPPRNLIITNPGAFPRTKVGRSGKPKVIRITNPNDFAVSFIRSSIGGVAARDYASRQPLSTILPPGSSTTVQVTFRPKRAGVRRAVLILLSDGPTSSMKLLGTGKPK